MDWAWDTSFSTTGVNSVVNAKVHDHTTTSGLQGSQMHLAPPAMSCVAGLQSFRATNPNSVHRTLYDVLKNFRGYQATDPRDMVFALVEVQYDSRDMILVSDYTRTVEELCTLVTYLMIRKYGINMCEAGLPNRALDHTSSWTIDWYAIRSSSVWTGQQACDERGKVSPAFCVHCLAWMHVTELDHANINFDCHRTFRPAAISNLKCLDIARLQHLNHPWIYSRTLK